MSKIIYACSRKTPFNQETERKVTEICNRLVPDNLTSPVPHKVTARGGLVYGVCNDRGSRIEGSSVLLGCFYGEKKDWAVPRSGHPDGSYALFRGTDDCVELVSDAAGSRTIWYCFDDELLVASTSQRAIVMYLERFEFDERVIPWMLSTGSLGPALSWDKRIKRLPPESSLVLDRKHWSISVITHPIAFTASHESRSAHKGLLSKAVRDAMQSVRRSVDFDKYVLPLSGGYDSRGILCFLGEKKMPKNLRTITWGLGKNIDRAGNDAAVAKTLASKVGVRHRYFHTDFSDEPVGKVIDRFIHCGEGRVDHLSGYMDGMEIWRRLLEEEKCDGIIRGDEGFGWIPVSSELTTRLSVGIGLCTDYRNLANVLEKFKLPRQVLPAELHRKKGERLNAWRDRLYHAYRMPTILAALSDIKFSYVEIINPLLARSVLHRVRNLPDGLRTDKALFKEIINEIAPDVPYANEGANASPGSILRKREIARVMRQSIESNEAKQLFDGEFLNYILSGMKEEGIAAESSGGRPASKVKSFIPRSLKNRIRDLLMKPSLDGNVLAFRVFLVLRMHEVLQADSTGQVEEVVSSVQGIAVMS